MGLPRDIINIVISMKSKDEKRRLNRNYYDKWEIYDSMHYEYSICLYYKSENKKAGYFINYRRIDILYYRKGIVCFLTNTRTKYEVPKNY